MLTEQLQTALNSRVVVEQAKGALAQIHDISPDEAFTCCGPTAARTTAGSATSPLGRRPRPRQRPRPHRPEGLTPTGAHPIRRAHRTTGSVSSSRSSGQ